MFPCSAKMSSCSHVSAVPVASAAAISTAPGWPSLAAADSIELVVEAVSLVVGHSAVALEVAVPAVAAGSLEPVVVIVDEPLPAELAESVGVGDWASTVVVVNPGETGVAELSVVVDSIAVTV